MEKDELFRALDGLSAYDSDCTDSGIKDDELKARVRDYLISQLKPNQVYPDILAEFVREQYLTDEVIKQGYGVEDAKEFIEWIDELLENDCSPSTPINLCPLIKDLDGEWVAFDDGYTKVIAHNKKLAKVVDEAKEKGFEKPILFRVPDKFIAQI